MRELRRLWPDRHAHFADALDLAFQPVSGLERAHTRRRAGHDDVAGRKLDHLGELPDDLRHVPDHLLEIAVLLHLAVDLEIDAALLRMADFGSGPQRPARGRAVEGLADL